MYKNLTSFVNSPEYLMLPSIERRKIEAELLEKEKNNNEVANKE